MQRFSGACPVCGEQKFSEQRVLWSELVYAWALSEEEEAYINRQQGFYCCHCRNNLRALALAAAICGEYGFDGTLAEFCTPSRNLSVLEINEAANLAPYLGQMSGHKLLSYPQIDMLDIAFPDETFDMVIHSDTLEHIADPVRALGECRRVLKGDGRCVFTVPIVAERKTRFRDGLIPSYHGGREQRDEAMRVHTEFGMDVWQIVLQAGFANCGIYALEYPAGLALIAKK